MKSINKKGMVILRDIMFMMLMTTAIFIFAGLFIGEMSDNYSNTNMSTEWEDTGTATLGKSTFYGTVSDLTTEGEKMATDEGNWLEKLWKGTQTFGSLIILIISTPSTLAGLVGSTLTDMGAGVIVGQVVKYLIAAILWGIILFTIISLFSKGGINV